MLLRMMDLGDLPRIVELEKQLFTSAWSLEDYDYELTKNDYAHYYVIEDHEEVLGYLGMWFMYEQATITTLGVEEKHQRQGLARKLMTHGLQEAQRAGCTSCSLEVRVSNSRAIALYESYGFEKKAIRKDYYADNHEDAYLMIKEGVESYGNNFSD